MTTKTVTIRSDGTGAIVVSKDDNVTPTTNAATGTPIVVHHHRGLDTGSFVAGLMLGLLLYFIVQSAMRSHARREARGAARAAAIGPQRDDGVAAAVAALARRTATLETIVTDPAQRTLRDIDALR